MHKTLNKKQLIEFGILIGFGIPVIFGFLIPKITGHNFREWTLWLGLFFLFLCIVNPKLLHPFYKIWMTLGKVLGKINSVIIFSFVFIFVLQPISLIMKAFGYDPLKLKECKRKTFRIEKKGYSIDLERIF